MKTIFSKLTKYKYELLIIIAVTFAPAIIFHKDISFDEVLFVNTWIELFGGGIIIALLFYLVTQWIEIKKNAQEDILNYNKIISIFTNTLTFFKKKEVNTKQGILFEYKRVPILLNNIKNEELNMFITKCVTENYEQIENAINNLQTTTLTQGTETQINGIITQLNLWKRNS